MSFHERIPCNQETSLNNNIEKNFTESIFENIDEIIETFAKNENITDYKLLEVHTTNKSVYGSIEIAGEKLFFKIAPPISIVKELRGYKIANIYPHETIRHYFINDDFGIYIQNFCEEINEKNGQVSKQVNKNLSLIEPANYITESTEEITKKIGTIYQNSFSTQTLQLSGNNDSFFYDRLKPNGRIDQLYKEKNILFPSINQSIPFNELLNYQIIIDGQKTEYTIKQLLEKAKKELNPDNFRYFVLSQGDLTETNMTLDGKFFDFEAAGYNALSQEIAIFIHFLFIHGHYIGPKYDKNYITDSIERKELDNFKSKIKVFHDVNITDQTINITVQFPVPFIKQLIITQYIENVVKPLELNIEPGFINQIIEELKSAIILRFVGVKDLKKFEEHDLILYIYMMQYFSKKDSNINSLSTFLEKKLKSINC